MMFAKPAAMNLGVSVGIPDPMGEMQSANTLSNGQREQRSKALRHLFSGRDMTRCLSYSTASLGLYLCVYN